MTWILTAISLAGNFLNCRKSVLGFYLWILCNIGWAVYDIYSNLHSRLLLDLVQTGFCIYGITCWKGMNNCMAKKKNADDIKNLSLGEQAQEILKIAEQNGVEGNFFFTTTFKRYLVQINLLNALEKQIKDDGTMVTKEYVKGRKNLYTNPAVNEYNKTASAANKTVETLMRVIAKFTIGNSEKENKDDALYDFLVNGKK